MARKRKRVQRMRNNRRKKRVSSPGRGWLLLAVGIILLAGAALAARQSDSGQSAADLAPPEVLAQGEAVYSGTCASCHGPEGEGNVGPALNGSMHAWHHVDNQLRSFIRDGIPNTAMAGHKDHLTDEDIDAVISYIKSWWTPEQREMQLTGRHPM